MANPRITFGRAVFAQPSRSLTRMTAIIRPHKR